MPTTRDVSFYWKSLSCVVDVQTVCMVDRASVVSGSFQQCRCFSLELRLLGTSSMFLILNCLMLPAAGMHSTWSTCSPSLHVNSDLESVAWYLWPDFQRSSRRSQELHRHMNVLGKNVDQWLLCYCDSVAIVYGSILTDWFVFSVVIWRWLGDRDCTAQCNCCLPATNDCRRFCHFCFWFSVVFCFVQFCTVPL